MERRQELLDYLVREGVDPILADDVSDSYYMGGVDEVRRVIEGMGIEAEIIMLLNQWEKNEGIKDVDQLR